MSMFQTLNPKPSHKDSSTCLLLDVSGSMAQHIELEGEDGIDPRRIDQMFKVVRETPECQGIKAFTFSSHCTPLECIPQENDHPSTEGSTMLADAFLTVKAAGFFSAILVTDGEPDSEAAALQAAAGMQLGIIYIGNPPVPPFLQRLADATNGTFALADMRTDQLAIELVKMLPSPDDKEPNAGGAINL